MKLLVELLCQKGTSQAKDSLWNKTWNYLWSILAILSYLQVISFNYNFWAIATLQTNTDINVHNLKELENQEGITGILLSS